MQKTDKSTRRPPIPTNQFCNLEHDITYNASVQTIKADNEQHYSPAKTYHYNTSPYELSDKREKFQEFSNTQRREKHLEKYWPTERTKHPPESFNLDISKSRSCNRAEWISSWNEKNGPLPEPNVDNQERFSFCFTHEHIVWSMCQKYHVSLTSVG